MAGKVAGSGERAEGNKEAGQKKNDERGERLWMIGPTLNTRASAIANSQMPKWRARKDSRGVSVVRGPVSEMNRRRRGESVRQTATRSNLGDTVRTQEGDRFTHRPYTCISTDAHVHAARDWRAERGRGRDIERGCVMTSCQELNRPGRAEEGAAQESGEIKFCCK